MIMDGGSTVPPRTATGLHLRVSLVIALIYGNFSSSSKVGNRSFPTTRSNSSCAAFRTSGNTVMASMKVFRVAAVVSLPAP